MNKIIARNQEIDTLERKYRSGKSEFVIVYGRRRIGKTFLVNNVFAERFTFTYVGARKQKQDKQLQRFAAQLKLYSGSQYAPALNSWEQAFNELRTLIECKPKDERKVIFFDEMPWIDTRQSQFVEALEYFWNAWAAQRTDILFIACGSATSWMVNKLIKNQGGLHNRITEQIYLRPFRLGECEGISPCQRLQLGQVHYPAKLHGDGWCALLYDAAQSRTELSTEHRPPLLCQKCTHARGV